MSASSIPNLLSLRGARGGARGRAQRHGGGGGGASMAARGAGRDATIQGTDTDAAVSRLSAVELGYLQDPFAQYFVQQAGPGPSTRRLPIINRGTYTRTAGLDTLIDRFVTAPDGADEQPQERQIISLGAGTDTRSLRLLSRPRVSGIVYHEIDFQLICTKKLNTIRAAPALRSLLEAPTVEDDGSSWCCRTPDGKSMLRFHGLDLRQLAQQPEQSSLKDLRTDIPTLLVSECCLCYLETSEAMGVVKWFADNIPNLGVLIYEPTKPDDPFGRTMISNLASRGITMPTLEAYRAPADQEARLRASGLEHARHLTVDDVWSRWVPEPEKERVDSLEGLDEVEEWKLLAGHYVISWGWRGSGFELWEGL